MSTDANAEALSPDSPTADSNSPDNRGDASQQEQPQQRHVCLSANPVEEGFGAAGRSGDESNGSGPDDRTESASSAPLPASPHAERTATTDSNKATSRQLASAPPIAIQRPPTPTEAIDIHQSQQQPKPAGQRDQSTLIPIPSPAADTSVMGSVPMQQQGGGSALIRGAGHGSGRQHSTAFDIFRCTQQQQAVVDPTSSMIDPSPVAAAAASGDQQTAGPSRPSPPSTPSPITLDQQHTANTRKGQTSASDAVAIMSLAADALLAGDIGPFVEQVEELNETPLLPDDGPVVEGLVRYLAKKDRAHRQQGRGGLAGCIAAIFNDSSNPSHQAAATYFLNRLCQAGYPFGVEWLLLFGVLVEETVKRLTLSVQEFMTAASVFLSGSIPVTAEALGAFQQHMCCHIDTLVETLATSSLGIVWRAYELIGIIFLHTRRGFPSELGVLASMCRSVSASPAALGKMAAVRKDHAACEWPDWMVVLCLNVPAAMAECGYCERVAQAGFLSAAMTILQSNRLTKDGRHGRAVVTASVHLLNLIVARNSYASCEGLSHTRICYLSLCPSGVVDEFVGAAHPQQPHRPQVSEVMCSLLSTVATSDAAYVASITCGGPIGMAIGVLDSLARFCDRQLMSGKAKDNPIVERVLQVDLSALSGPPTAGSQNSLIQEILDLLAKFRRRKEAIDRWVSSQHDPHREAARRQNKQNRLVRCLSDKRVLHTIYQLVGPSHFAVAQVAMLALSCRSLLDALCPVRSTDRISPYANRELLAPFASISVSKQNRLVAALARYSPDMMLTLSIHWECSPTADDISDLIGFLQRADRLMTLRLMFMDLTQVPDDECAQLADAIGRLPSLATLHLEEEDLSCAFAGRLSAVLKARPEGDGKGGSSSETVSPPPSSSRGVTRAASTSSAVVPADSAEDSQGTTEAG
ncbi:unnamed protein product [Vitrella brassicaformis CCMP3155]|uniref:Uncharacterized protein n=1 Tax=Vitrella brassicaformis (strain CCMP3155) TaxID=1169540 RepID=A0A0G4EFJ0_VITBC|nr:unnamed protein product [Vitrella brassicaformis CCMP3155]|eukprot:CEL94271.1 unnamed protein product [Vitrella brassicaformis CCMP3155]